MSAFYPIPQWRATLDGVDITDRIAPRLLDLSLTESRGDEADQVDLRLHDHDGRLALPRRGVTLALAFGWADSGMVNKGTFVVDEAEHSGPPDIITIRARSADLTHSIRTRRERSWHDTTLGAVLRTLAGGHSLKAAIAPALDSVALPHLDQANKSDVNLLTRLGKRFDAVATIKAGTLIFKPIDATTTGDGISLPVQKLTRASGDSHRYAVVDRDAVTGVRAYWGDRGAAQGRAGGHRQEREEAAGDLRQRERGAATCDGGVAAVGTGYSDTIVQVGARPCRSLSRSDGECRGHQARDRRHGLAGGEGDAHH